MSRHVDTGSTDQTIVFWAFDSDGVAVEVTTSDSVSYRVDNNGREGTPVSMTLVARSVAGTHRDNAITYKGDGKHEIDLPDAAVASAGEVTLEVTKSGVASVYVEKLEVSANVEDKVWDASMADHTGSTTYGGRIVRASNSNVTVQITGSNHIAADIHNCQPDGLTDSTEITAINTLATRLTTMIEVDGLVYRYTTNALEQSPSADGSTDWTANERTAIRTILGIPGSGTTPADPSDGVLYDIKQKTDQIGSASAVTSLLAGAVLDPGTITSFPSELVIGDSYQETDGREIQIPLVDTDGNVLTTIGSRNLADATATFEIRRINESDSTRVITGVATIVDPPGTGTTTALGAPYAVIELPASETLKGLPSYRYYGKITLEWAGPGTDIMSFKTDVIKFTY